MPLSSSVSVVYYFAQAQISQPSGPTFHPFLQNILQRTGWHLGSWATQIPMQSRPPFFGSQESLGLSSQVEPEAQSLPAMPPQEACVAFSSHGPSLRTLTPCAAAVHELLWVLPSQPQTGANMRLQI
jgi:hypothetical protein